MTEIYQQAWLLAFTAEKCKGGSDGHARAVADKVAHAAVQCFDYDKMDAAIKAREEAQP